jgi:(E)-4-hydroxy-3-methyl-but-2-enyl pyrophosphate reductase
MKVLLAGKAGFCMGVRRAMDIIAALPHEESETIYTDGPIIHNPQVIEILKKRSIVPLEEETDLTGKKVIIRTHGITPKRAEELVGMGADLINVTCPRVQRIHRIIKRHRDRGYNIIIYGDSKHQEVIALLGYAGNSGFALDSIEKIKNLPDMEKVCVVSQSTKNRTDYEEFIHYLRKRFDNAEVFDTLCDSTTQRQMQALILAEKVDAVVVVGGYSSANTRTLAEVAKKSGKPVYHVETEKEINIQDFKSYSTVGVTAGASTPGWMIDRVTHFLRQIKGKDESSLLFYLNKLARFLMYSNLLVSIDAVFLSYAAAALLGIDSGWRQYLIAPLYVYSMSILNLFVDFKSLELNQPSKVNFLIKYRIPLIISAVISGLLTVIIAATLQLEALLVILVALCLGLIYSVPILPEGWTRRIHLHRLRDIPASKDILVATAWAAMTVFIHPLSMHGLRVLAHSSIAAFLWVFGIVFIRMIVGDIRYLQGDAIIGHGTIPVLIGTKPARNFLISVTLGIAVLLILTTNFGFVTSLGYFLILPLIYSLIYQLVLRKKRIKSNLLFEVILDVELVLYGVVALIWNFNV